MGSFQSPILPGFLPSVARANPIQDDQLMEVLRKIQQQLGPPGCYLTRSRSCQEILYSFPSAPSGYYQIHAANGSVVQVYCDMEGTNCGGEGGWTRMAYINMTQSGSTCPQGLSQKEFTAAGLTLCGRIDGEYVVTTSCNGGCQGTVFSTLGLNYSRVAGLCLSLHGWLWYKVFVTLRERERERERAT